MVTSMPLTSCFITPFHSKRVHEPQTLLRPALRHFCPNFPLIQQKFSWKRSLQVRSKILGLFGNTLNSDHMSSRHRRQKLPKRVQTLFSQKRRTFSAINIVFLESTQNFPYFEKRDQLHSLNIMQVIDPEKCGYFNAPKLLF